ncbi:MAG: SIR2 family protein [Saprospiraceae bacterium]|nr:SIR2 family protein [Saprospiraceae bacterium]
MDILSLEPNLNHNSIASWVQNRKVTLIITTNFDSFIENALDSKGIPNRVYLNKLPKHFIKYIKKRNFEQVIPVYKPHGSLMKEQVLSQHLRNAGLS